MSIWKTIQQNGKSYFAKHGFPTKQLEEWKYTSVKVLQETEWTPAIQQKKPAAPVEGLLKTYLNSAFDHLVFINGQYSAPLSTLKSSDAIEVQVFDTMMPTALAEDIVVNFAKQRQKVGGIRQDSFEALNSSEFKAGVLLKIKKAKRALRPIQILHLLSGDKVVSYPRLQVVLEDQAEVSLLETYISDQTQTWSNSVTEISVGRGAHLEIVRLQNEGALASNIGSSRIYLSKDSQLYSLSYTTGARLSRHNLDVHCLEENASAQVNGVSMLSQSQHSDHHTWIDHAVGHCTTSQLYKSILDDSSRSVFNGRVLIRQDAQKAFSEQLNKNLLLTTQAEADSKPELQIYADDVKATHGSTVGQLNPDEIFYFLSRGISREKALEILSLGFVNDVVAQVRNPLVREFLEKHLASTYQNLRGTKV